MDLRNADLRNADLRYAYLRNADLRNVNLRNADLRYAYLRNADLKNVNLRNADLRNSNLRNADLKNVNLRNADLRNSNLSGAELSNTILDPFNQANGEVREFDNYTTRSGLVWCKGSTCTVADCHPGLYVKPNEEIGDITVWFFGHDCHHVGDKWRVRKFWVEG